MHIYLIRHAQSENNALTPATIHKRKADPGLTTLGFQPRHDFASILDTAEAMRRGEATDVIPTGLMFGEA